MRGYHNLPRLVNTRKKDIETDAWNIRPKLSLA